MGLLEARFAFNAARTVLHEDKTVDRFRPVYRNIAQTPAHETLNSEPLILAHFLEIGQRRNLAGQIEYRAEPYWLQGVKYNSTEVFGTLIQFVDYHKTPIPSPTTALPPEADVQRFIHQVMSSDHPVPVWEQFEMLLDITGNNVLGAAHLGFIATRLMARGLESRAYPNIHVGEEELRAWNTHVAHFELFNNSNKNDAPGDNYYFWTHMFGALFFSHCRHKARRAFQFAVEHGTEIMVFARKYIAHLPTNARYYESSLIGRNIGLAFADPL